MNEAPKNQYSPVATESRGHVGHTIVQTRYLWAWLVFATLASFFVSPADPISFIITLLFGLLSFFVGVCLASSASPVARTLATIVWCGLTASTFLSYWSASSTFAIGFVAYSGVSLALGHQAFRSLESVRDRSRILAGFAVGYIVGSIVGLIWLGPILGVILAKRSIASR